MSGSLSSSLWQQEVNQIDNPFRYAGEYQDSETGNYYLRARYYDPETERFISEDSAQYGKNWYTFCGNNPVNMVDPSGLKQQSIRKYYESKGYQVIYDSPNCCIKIKEPGSQDRTTKMYLEHDNKGDFIFDKNGIAQFLNPPADALSNSKTKLTQEQKLLIATVYGEASNCSEASWRAVANVIMNRVGTGEWKKYDTVTKVIKYTGFDAYTHPNNPYKTAENYLNHRDGSNAELEELIRIVLDVYNGKSKDNTNGAVLYYSPKAQARLHKANPQLYPSKPSWNFNVLQEVKVKGAENDDLKFYRYK